MSLDEELRAVLGQEAGMRYAERLPDVGALISGGRVRRRRRNAARVGVGVLAAAVIGGGAYGVAQVGREDARPPATDHPTEPTATSGSAVPRYRDTDQGPLPPGTYRMFVGVGESGPIEADITFAGRGWGASNHPVIFDDPFAAGVGVYQVEDVARGSGCHGDERLTPAAETPNALARQLARLPRSSVQVGPESTEMLGIDAVHLRLRIDDNCVEAAYRPVDTVGPGGGSGSGRGISYAEERMDEIIDFWVLEVDGTTIVIDLFRHPGASADVVQQVYDARDSITFVTVD